MSTEVIYKIGFDSFYIPEYILNDLYEMYNIDKHSAYQLRRHDQRLVKLFKRYKESSQHAASLSKFKIKKITSNRYIIDDYDNSESVITNANLNWINVNENNSLSILVKKYKSICESLVKSDFDVEIKQLENDEQNPIHLLWMLNEIEFNNDQSETKKHRWLGYIQGILISKGVFNVIDERNSTRDILNGK